MPVDRRNFRDALQALRASSRSGGTTSPPRQQPAPEASLTPGCWAIVSTFACDGLRALGGLFVVSRAFRGLDCDGVWQVFWVQCKKCK